MNRISDNKLKRFIGLTTSVFCMMLMLLGFISYTSNSSLKSGGSVVMDDRFSIFKFLFDGKYEVLDSKVSILRDIFTFSYVIMWVSFILYLTSVILMISGLVFKKSILMKIGSIAFLVGILALSLMVFDEYKMGNTVKYLDVFTPLYGVIVLVSVVGVASTITLNDK